ncbi:DoxX family protein [Chitinophaga vietnamensis]|uniref:DoxX family protein n=1 Tax=Chitinophaga vietnamensis TaxID=2593957 RepID=UPI001177BD84|nr:DoxX family protein [Chitinophaga vietnamensis]
MNTILWVLQVLLAATFLYSGVMKATQRKEYLMTIGQTGAAYLSYPALRMLAVAEILGAAGIILPWALHIAPVLTPISALCFALIMAPASRIHYRRGEYKSVAFNIFLFVISIFVAVQRW